MWCGLFVVQEYAPQQILMGLMCGNLHLDIPEWCEPEWRGLLEACLEPNPSNRPSMRELARQLEAIRDQQLAHEQQLQREQQLSRRSSQAAQQVQQQVQEVQQVRESPRAQQLQPQPPQQVQQLEHQMQQLFAQPAPLPPQPQAPAPVALLHHQQRQQILEQRQLSQRHIQEQQELSQRHQVQQQQLQVATIESLKQHDAVQHQATAQSALQGINLSAHAGVMAAAHHAAAVQPHVYGPGQLGLQHSALQAAAALAAQQHSQQQEQLQLQQACGPLQPQQPLQQPRGLGYIQPI